MGLAVSLFVALSCGYGSPSDARVGGAPRSTVTDARFFGEFLDTWLVRRDVDGARVYLSSDFFVVPALRDAQSWPEGLRYASAAERVLRFPYQCPQAPRKCSRLSDCIESSKGEGTFEVEPFKVDAGVIAANPELKSREGQELLLVSFMLKGCNVGASLIVEKEVPGKQRVLSIFYIAG